MPSFLRTFCLLSLLSLLGLPALASAGEIVFANSAWKITVQPDTLQVTANVPGSSLPFLVSAAQAKALRAANVKVMSRQAQWKLPDKHLTVTMRLEGDTLAVGFRSAKVGEFTWPALPAQSSVRGYILPIGEGVYAPAHDAAWGAYLAKQEGLSTTDGLYLPLWGLDCGTFSLTYLLTNQFNNELAFQEASGGLAARFTHQFTKNWNVKEYGLRISLGPASPIEPARRYRRWLMQTGQFVSMKAKIAHTPEAAKLLGAAHAYLWGDGISPQMMETLRASGLDRLWLGVDGWDKLRSRPEAIRKAKAFGYLIGPYDSYHSIHSPDAKPEETWETAQFDRPLYETGAITRWDGQKKAGFQHKGYLLSPLVAQPYVEKRVSGLMTELHCNSWFIDCDAFGEVFDDYSPQHPATQEQDMKARLKRMAWIRDTYGLVIGSEGGASYAASTIHFAHGMMTPAIGFGDPDLTDPNSPYFLGRYAPDRAPTVFFKPVPLKPDYYRHNLDPRFRLPLYQAVFHDSVVTTHHWSSPSLKFKDQVVERTLLELLYNIPPLYHLNQNEFAHRKAWMQAHYAFFSPLHRQTALLPLTDFSWLTPDRQIQRTAFGKQIEMIANFRTAPFTYQGRTIPAASILAINTTTGQNTNTIFTPKTEYRPKHIGAGIPGTKTYPSRWPAAKRPAGRQFRPAFR